MAKEQQRVVGRLAGIISFDDESDSDDSATPVADAYMEGYSRTGDRKGKETAWKW